MAGVALTSQITDKTIFADIFHNSTSDILAIKGMGFKYLAVNETGCRFFQKSASEIIGKTDYDLFSKEIADTHLKEDEEILRTGKRLVKEESITGPHAPVWFSVLKDPVIRDGNIIAILVSVRNIDGEKRVAEHIRQSNELLFTLTEGVNVGIVLTDLDRKKLLYKNGSFMRTFRSLTSSEDGILQILKNVPARYTADETPRDEVFEYRKPDEERWFSVTARVVNWNQGEQLILHTFSEITHYKEVEQLKEEIQQVTAHDLKAPLTALINVPAIVMAEANLTDTQKEHLTLMRNAAQRMSVILEKSLMFLQLENGAYRVEKSSFNIIPQLFRIIEELKRISEARSVLCRVLIEDRKAAGTDDYRIWSSETPSYSLFMNLIKNAVEASPPGKQVTVRIQKHSSGTRCTIHNYGTVPLEIRDRFFQKYATCGKPDGTGLGTYSAKLIVEAHGGQLGFTTSEEEGTTVTVVLPQLESAL